MPFNSKEFFEDVIEIVVFEISQKLSHVHVTLPMAMHVERNLPKSFHFPEGVHIQRRLHLPSATSNRLPVPASQDVIELAGAPDGAFHTDHTRLSRQTESTQLQFTRQRKDVPSLGFAVYVVHVEPHAAKMRVGARVRTEF